MTNHLCSISDLKDNDVESILKSAKKNSFHHDTLKNRIVVNLFFENSTRTRTSFEIAALRLGASVINWDAEISSLKKGESFADTIETLGAMKPDGLIIRHSDYNAPHYVAQRVSCSVINAGDSWREHPTQALLDAFTIKEAKGKIEGLTVAICGDVTHSRVANSNMMLLSRLGAKIRVIAPDFLMPQKFPVQGIESFTSMERGLPGCDIVMMLRNQKERMDSSHIPDDRTFFKQYGLTAERLGLAKPDAFVMHPGPMNRNVEIADVVADDPQRSLILRQVANGVPVRMAILEWALA